jgi:hypothetical protein
MGTSFKNLLQESRFGSSVGADWRSANGLGSVCVAPRRLRFGRRCADAVVQRLSLGRDLDFHRSHAAASGASACVDRNSSLE